MDFQSAMETFAEAWVAANAGAQTQALALTRPKSPSLSVSANPQSVSMGHGGSNGKDEAAGITSPRSTSSNHSGGGGVRGDAVGHPNNGNMRSPSSSSSLALRDRSRSPPINKCSQRSNSNQSTMHCNSNNNSPTKRDEPSLDRQNSKPPSLIDTPANLATNYFAHNHLKLAENLINSSSGNFLNNHLLNAKINENGISPEKTEDDSSPPPPQTPLSHSGGMDRKAEFDFSKVNAKSLPLHCVVESVSSLQSVISGDSRGPWKRRSNVETDSYVIVPAVTQFCNIVATALQRLGYSQEIANTARGSIVIKNWKPLELEKICDNPLITVGDVLGELTSVVTLRISILRTKPSIVTEIKDKLLKLLILQSHAILRSSGCPLDELTLSQLCRNSMQSPFPFSGEISDETRRKFDMWWSSQLSPQSAQLAPKLLPFVNPAAANMNFSPSEHLSSVARAESMMENHHPVASHHHQQHHNLIVHPALQTVHSQYPSQKTRMRTSFDPEMELPKLQRWFQENPHPSRQQIQSYVIQLNSLESRRGRKPLDVNNVVYWFKNARAAQKRAEIRGQSLANGYGNSSLLLHPGYLKSPHSVPSEDIDNLSQHSDDMDDDMDRPPSPQVPLSLTTHERHRSPSSSDDHHSLKVEKEEAELNNNDSPSKNHNGSTSIDHTTDISSDQIPHSNVKDNNPNSENNSPCKSPKSEDLDMEDSDLNTMDDFRSPSPDSRRDLPFPIVPNSMFSQSFMYMSHYMPQIGQGGHHSQQQSISPNSLGPGGLNLSSLSSDERRKRNRTFIDPVTEVPKLEQWFAMNTHPSHNLILKYTEDLNRMPYRQKFPRLESKNVQFWFKNRRAKCKRLKMSLYDTSQLSVLNPFPGEMDERKMYQHVDRD